MLIDGEVVECVGLDTGLISRNANINPHNVEIKYDHLNKSWKESWVGRCMLRMQRWREGKVVTTVR